MRLVTQTDVLARMFGEEQSIRILANSGFDAIDWSFFAMLQDDNPWCQPDWRERALKMKAVAEECGIGFSQAHAPFPSSKGEEPFDTVVMERILRSMEIASIMGVRNIVVHPRQHLPYVKYRQQLFEENVAFYKSLIPHCARLNIHVCAENMWQFDRNRNIIVDSVCARPEEFCAMIDAVDSPWIVACLDLGHAALTGQDPADMIRALGHDRLQALHVHDVDHLHDCHTLPFTRNLDWESIAAALGEIDFQGDFTFEADNFLAPFPRELQQEASAFMAKTGRYLINRVEAHRNR